ncbi:hypothetical protein [Arthronema virus TR020]|uniref:Uncharacterized protein n=1 Tax=Arthronema virus TR020 TaxID=2736280 RepID=A0A7G3WH09_9CAUD|nr:hypothetical protein [Arthronema virus TR020]
MSSALPSLSSPVQSLEVIMFLVIRTHMVRETYAHVVLLGGKSILVTRREYDNECVFVSPVSEDDVVHTVTSLKRTQALLLRELHNNLLEYGFTFDCPPYADDILKRVKRHPNHRLYPLTMKH